MRSRTAIIALLGLGCLALASARDLKQAYGSTSYSSSSYGSTGPNTIVVSGVIPPVQTGCGTCTTGTVTNTNCPPELTEVDPVQVITPCDIQYQAAPSTCTSKNVEDQFQNVWGGGKLHPDDVTNINYHVGQYLDSTLYAQQGVPSSVSTNCFKKPAATYAAASYPAGYAKSAAVKHKKAMAPKPMPVTGTAKPVVVAPKPVVVAPKPVGTGYPAATASYDPPMYNMPVLTYGEVARPNCYVPSSYTPTCQPSCAAINYYASPSPAFQGITILKEIASTTTPQNSPQACWVKANWVDQTLYKEDHP